MTTERPQAPDGDRLAGLDRPLRNRVTPAGELIATEHRGTMYGNRGVLHNEDLALVRRHQVRRWLVCVLEFRGRRRPILRPRRYTELFFHDEAVALAAGHRPCAECRHAAYQSFLTAWTTARALPAKPAADDIDLVLHAQRGLVDGARVTYPALLSELPDGVFIVHDGEYWLANDDALHRWTAAGYADRIDQFDGPAAVLTPRATVEAMRAGYRPLIELARPTVTAPLRHVDDRDPSVLVRHVHRVTAGGDQEVRVTLAGDEARRPDRLFHLAGQGIGGNQAVIGAENEEATPVRGDLDLVAAGVEAGCPESRAIRDADANQIAPSAARAAIRAPVVGGKPEQPAAPWADGEPDHRMREPDGLTRRPP
jgi:hypothetical protein